MALSKNKSQKSQNLELKLKGLNMTVAELYGANNTPYDDKLLRVVANLLKEKMNDR